jgi:signal transduction histidine kinase
VDALADRFALLAPLHLRGQLVGLLVVDGDEVERAYTQEEIALAGAVAKLAALVLERERLLREREEARAAELALRTANKQMDEFLSMASHELRTPLTSVKAYIQIAQRRARHIEPRLPADCAQPEGRVDPIDPVALAEQLAAVQVPLERANQHSDMLNRLVGDLLDASRIQAHRLEMRFAPCDLAVLVREAVEEQQLAWPGRTLTCDLAPDAHAAVYADGARIKQVVTNYLTNALKYAPAAEPIAVAVRVGQRQARVEVRDHGPGIPAEERERIWQRFHRTAGVRTQNGTDGGLGLGLYISRGIVELHGGAVGVECAADDGPLGATFFLTLPLAGDTGERAS